MDDRAALLGHGRAMVPNLYTIELSETDYERLGDYEDELSDDLVAAAQEHAESQRYQPHGPLEVHLVRGRGLETGRLPGASGHVQARRPGVPQQAHVAAPRSSTGARPSTSGRSPPRPTPRSNPSSRPWLDIDGDRYPLLGSLTTLGRDDTADIVLDDPGVSRRHSEIRVTTDGPHLVTSIRDLDSTNGTFVNGERITSQRLQRRRPRHPRPHVGHVPCRAAVTR